MTPGHLAISIVIFMVVVLYIVSVAYDDWRSSSPTRHIDTFID